jgi:polyferredoxin
MNIIHARRISQSFFLILFLWFCIVMQLGEKAWHLRGWPVGWLIQLDPLVGLGTLLATHALYAGLLWGLASVVLTIFLGRFFCGWLCPFGTLQQAVGFLARRKRPLEEKAGQNRYRKAQGLKYWILFFLLSASAGHFLGSPLGSGSGGITLFHVGIGGLLAALALLTLLKVISAPRNAILWLLISLGIWAGLSLLFPGERLAARGLQTGLLDPIPLLYRSMNLVLLPLLDAQSPRFSPQPRHHEEAWLIGAIFLAAVLLSVILPRFYCRFVCPTGALFGLLSRWSLWRIAKTEVKCRECRLCEAHCEGACDPSSRIRWSECVLCMNCLHPCPDSLMKYRTAPSASGEIPVPDIGRREIVTSLVSGALMIPMLRLNGSLAANWNPHLVRPPGSLPEEAFLSRCIKCGLCMRICPTNVLHPAGLQGGLEALWTPVLNFRVGSSGCQVNCIACGNVCPTAAIRPLSPEERLGTGPYKTAGPVRIGTAFVDQGRCLPWAMDRPCIVCQENCPVSPKAIFTREAFVALRQSGPLTLKEAGPTLVEVEGASWPEGRLSSGDYFLRVRAGERDLRLRIAGNDASRLMLADPFPLAPAIRSGETVVIEVRLQRPFVSPERCTGCGICEHECPVAGKRAIRVTAEGESRSPERAMILKSQ